MFSIYWSLTYYIHISSYQSSLYKTGVVTTYFFSSIHYYTHLEFSVLVTILYHHPVYEVTNHWLGNPWIIIFLVILFFRSTSGFRLLRRTITDCVGLISRFSTPVIGKMIIMKLSIYIYKFLAYSISVALWVF